MQVSNNSRAKIGSLSATAVSSGASPLMASAARKVPPVGSRVADENPTPSEGIVGDKPPPADDGFVGDKPPPADDSILGEAPPDAEDSAGPVVQDGDDSSTQRN